MITKKQFETYLEIQKSGITNMFDVKKVIQLSNETLDKKDCIEIMENYSGFKEEYGEKDEEYNDNDNDEENER